MMKQEFLLKLTPYQEVFYDKWKLSPLNGDSHIILDQTFSGAIDIERLNISLIRFVNHNLLVNSNIINVDGELFWKSRSLIPDTASLLILLSNQTDPDELLKFVLKPFDLENEQLSRFYIIKQDDEKYRIIYVFSSILIDRLTDNFLYSELSKYYNNTSYVNPLSLSQQTNLLDELNREIRSILDNGKEVISDFWKKYLTNIENPGFRFLEIYSNKSVNHCISLAEISFVFSEEVLSRIKLLTETYKLTPYAYGQLILAVLLHRISGVNHLIINYPVSIKKQQDYILGSHVNTIVKGYYFSSDSRLKDLINQNVDYLNNLWDTKADYLPVSDLIKYASRPDILEFNFSQASFKNLFINYEGITDIRVNQELSPNIVGKISIEQEIKDGILHYKVVYNSSQLNSELVTNFIELYKNLFVCILDDLLNNKTNRLISGYHLLNYEMHHQMIHSQNNTVNYYDREVTVHGLFEDQAFRTPDLTALV
ncbi:condensation domain-containing protein, partial [Chryseobacterium sp. S90]|uniref:condensation domain-containing protein n=1 Tax=Chryseobacterium sp. S90 TaxID=3395373 RepID=UPI0039BC3E55